MAFNKEHAIIAQNSATAAATIVASLGFNTPGEATSAFDTIREHIFNGTLTLGGTEMVVNAFETASVANVVAAAAPQRPAFNNVVETPFPTANDTGPGSVVLKFGKHRGKTIAQVAVEDAGWLDWASQNTNNAFVKDKIREFLAA